MREEARREGILFAAALLVRILYVADLRALPFFDLPTGDALFYARRAAEIASGGIVGEGLAYPSSPLYPYLVAPFFLLPGAARFWGVYLAQGILDSAHAVLLKRLGERLFGPAAGWAAGCLWAGYGLAVFLSADLVEATMAAFACDAALLLLLGARPLRAGAFFGAAALLRPHVLALLPIAALAAAWLTPARRLRAAALLLAGSAAALLPSLLRNAAASGEWVLVSPYSGLNAYLGNHRGATGGISFPPGVGLRNDMDLREAARAYPEASAGRPLSEREVSTFWWRETGREIAADPAAWAGLLARKAALVLGPNETPSHLDYHYFVEESWALRLAPVSFGWIAPFALAGALWVLCAGGGGPGGRVLVILAGAYAGAQIVFFAGDRFRLPGAGWACLLGGGALAALARAAVARRLRAAAALAAVAALAALVLHRPLAGARGAREHILVASALAGRGRVAEADRLLARAAEIDPGSAVVAYNLGRLHAAMGREDDAAADFTRASGIDPGFDAAWAALADLLARRPGRRVEAIEAYRKALTLEPYGREARRIREVVASLEREGPPGG